MRFARKNDITKEDGWVNLDLEAPPPPGSAPEYQDTVRGRIVLTNAGAAITAEGWLHTTARMQCSRCANLHSVDVRITVAEECALEEIDSPISSRFVDPKISMVFNITAPDYRGDIRSVPGVKKTYRPGRKRN